MKGLSLVCAMCAILVSGGVGAETAPDDMRDRMIAAVLKSRSVYDEDLKIRTPWWFACGVKLDESEMPALAEKWVDTFLASAEKVESESSVRLNRWGTFAMLENESGFNECAIDFQTRKWAASVGVVDKFQVTYSRDDVWAIVSSEQFKKENRKADLSPYQVRYGVKQMKKDFVDALLDRDYGVLHGMREMARRIRWYMASRRTSVFPDWLQPWLLWPGKDPLSSASSVYTTKIIKKARWLGARKDEV